MKKSHERQIIEKAERALDHLALMAGIESITVMQLADTIRTALRALARLEDFRTAVAAQLFRTATDLQDIAERNDR
jgi:hypothetical protein